jgi:hypothetical protein
MHPALEKHLERMRADIEYYRTSEHLLMDIRARAERIVHLEAVIAEILRLVKKDEESS